MPASAQLLKALSSRAKVEIKYFEFVTIRVENDGKIFTLGDDHGAPGLLAPGLGARKAYLCVGKHALVLLRPGLQRASKGSLLEYRWLEKVVQDTGSVTEFALVMAYERPQECPAEIFVTSENRANLLTQMSISYVADAMFRLGKIVAFPKVDADLESEVYDARVLPFEGYKEVVFKDYTFFLQKRFEEVVGSSPAVQTGVYRAPARDVLGKTAAATQEGPEPELEVALHIYDPVPLSDLGKIGREHIRWLAMEYKQACVRNQQTYVLRNKFYLKKMNLSNDVAAWLCWELFLKDKQQAIVVVLLRRQYVPPLMDTAQDFALVLKCPVAVLRDSQDLQEDLVHEAHVMADSISPQAHGASLYTGMIQARLDTLLYDAEAYGWIRSRLKLKPDGETRLEKYALIFFKGILKILRDEGALQHTELWDDACRRVAALCEKKSEQDLDPMVVAEKVLHCPAEGLDHKASGDRASRSKSAWHARVAQYLSYSTDGGLFGSKFTLADIITNLARGTLASTAARKLAAIVTFLLHLRPKDLGKRWEPKPLQNQLLAMGLLGAGATAGATQLQQTSTGMACTFNDRVMQLLLEMGYLQKLLPPQPGEGATSVQYAHLLQHLLRSDQSSVNLKASICRQIVAARDAEQGTTLCGGLMHVMSTGGIFLATYACAALVNLSQAKDVVKNFLLHSGIDSICLNQLKSKDDDLILYTLMLLVHLTKTPSHRKVLLQRGLVPRLYDILEAAYNGITESTVAAARCRALEHKRRVVTELCSVLGQVCNDEEPRRLICDGARFEQRPVDCLLLVFDTAELLGDRKAGEALPPNSPKLLSKVLFALKQLCASSAEKFREDVGGKVINSVVKDLQNPQNLEHRDWATNAILLLLLLAITQPNCQSIQSAGWSSAYRILTSSPLGRLDATRDRIQHLHDRVMGAAHEFASGPSA